MARHRTPVKAAAFEHVAAAPAGDVPPPDDQAKKKPSMREMGVVSSLVGPFATLGEHEAYDMTHVSIRQLQDMVERDGQAASIYRTLTMPLKSAEIIIRPSKGGKREADFIKDQLTAPFTQGGMRTPWSTVVGDLSRALLTGAEVLEKVWVQRGEWVVLDKLASRPRSTLEFIIDDRGDYDGVFQQTNGPRGKVKIKPDKTLLFVVNKQEHPVFGQSMLLPSYYHYEKKHKLYYVGHLGFALNAIPIRIGEIPQDASEEDKKSFEKALASIGVNTSMTKPEGWGLTFEHSQAPADMIPFVDHHNMMMAMSVLTQVANLGTSGSSGSYALSETHLELLMLMLEGLMNELSFLLNTRLIPELIDWNFGTRHYPTIIIKPRYNDRRAAIKEIFQHISGASQVNFSPEFMLALEQAMAEICGIDQEIDYEKLHDQLLGEARRQKQVQGGIENADNAKSQLDLDKQRVSIERKKAENDANRPVVAPGGAKPQPRSK